MMAKALPRSASSSSSAGTPPLLTRQLTSHLDSAEENIAAGAGASGSISAGAGGEENDALAAALAAASTGSSPKGLDGEVATKLSPEEAAIEAICAVPGVRVQLRCGIATDIGGGTVNQDDAEILNLSPDVVVFGVFDGHGRELGELASQVAKESIRASFKVKGMVDKLRASPEQTMIELFKKAHEDIRTSFREKYTKAKWEVVDTDEGYIIKRQNAKSPWTCTHGGTTATVVVILDGRRMIVANVGDSSAVWGGKTKDGTVISKELNAEHSPESIEEYKRICAFRPASGGITTSASSIVNALTSSPKFPTSEMKFVYDAPSYSKNQCNSIFEHDSADPNKLWVTGNGNYYKNVRNEWATLVTTPPNARFQDALAFTRSLGDLHLHAYGVSEIPAVQEYDLVKMHASVAHGPTKKKLAPGIEVGTNGSVLFVCSDGVWDNWKFDEIVEFSLKDELTEPSLKSGSAQKATDEIMRANIALAKSHFGSQADNMTAIVCYVYF